MDWVLESADTAGVRRLRHQIMRTLGRLAAPDSDLAAAGIVVAELLGNTLAHTPGPAWISLRWDGVHPLLSVCDLGPGFDPAAAGSEPALVDAAGTLVPRLPADPLAEAGRGLYLVSTLALDVAVVRRATGGTVVSVTLNLKSDRDQGWLPAPDRSPKLSG